MTEKWERRDEKRNNRKYSNPRSRRGQGEYLPFANLPVYKQLLKQLTGQAREVWKLPRQLEETGGEKAPLTSSDTWSQQGITPERILRQIRGR